ncbi:MAG TPA: efflux RND transporter permease subunit [Tepidisphaeraceae bacterium]|nr:efflux RND transporter permease subunit [Tepidisphaeraceae bacterium]
MNLCEPFIRRPVMTTLVTAAILIFGIMAYLKLPVSDLPQVDFPTIQVMANLPGASPETVAASVATPLERQFTTIAGLDSMSSNSVQGRTSITLQFNLSRNIDDAALDVEAAISRANRQLPPEMPAPPSFQKVNPADQPVLFLTLTSPTLPLYQLDEFAETMVAQNISTVEGVAQVQVFGAQKYAVRIQVDPQKLASKGIGIDEVSDKIASANVNLPTGVIDGRDRAYTVQATGQLVDAAAYRPVIVAYRNGNPVRLREVGNAIDSVENNKTAAWFNEDRGIILAVQRQPGTNTVQVVDDVKKLLPVLQRRLPAAVSMDILQDRSLTIRESVADVKFTLWLSLALVIGVIFIFLRNIRATLIPSLAIPMSIIGTFAIMYMMGFSVDNLSLMALTLSIGFVVDDAIVMLENCVRHMELGSPPLQATLVGSREIGFTIVSMTISLAAVFIPVLFMPGLLGRLLNEFAIVIGVAILFSGVVSLSLTPMLCSRFLKPPSHTHGSIFRMIERGFDGFLWIYEVGLRWSLRHRLVTLVFSAAVLVATGWLFTKMPTGFLPNEDIGQIRVNTEAAEGVSFQDLMRYQQMVASVIRQDTDVEGFMSVAGARGTSNSGNMNVRLKDRDQRKTSAERIIQRLRPKLAQVPGIKAVLQIPPPIQIGGQITKAQYQFSLQSPDTSELYKYTPIIEQKMREVAGLQDVTTDLLLRNPQVLVDIDRDRASALNVSAQRVEMALSSAYGTRQISTIYMPTNSYQVILELDPQYQKNPQDLPLLYINSSEGKLIPIRSLTKLTQTLGPLSVNHVGQLPSVTLSFNLKPGYSLGDAVNAVSEIARQTLPPTIITSFQGTAQVFQSSLTGLGVLLIVSILVIYIVLGILYESFIHPITILTALPFAGFGALLTLKYFGFELNLYGFVGIIMLVGLVKKNGIMMVDFAIEAQRNQEKSAEEAIYEACVVRFRPIMMTTMAALLGTLPIALGIGAGAESRQSLGLAVVGGLLFSQFLTLFVTPVFYLYMEKFRTAFSGRSISTKIVTPVEELAI